MPTSDLEYLCWPAFGFNLLGHKANQECLANLAELTENKGQIEKSDNPAISQTQAKNHSKGKCTKTTKEENTKAD